MLLLRKNNILSLFNSGLFKYLPFICIALIQCIWVSIKQDFPRTMCHKHPWKPLQAVAKKIEYFIQLVLTKRIKMKNIPCANWLALTASVVKHTMLSIMANLSDCFKKAPTPPAREIKSRASCGNSSSSRWMTTSSCVVGPCSRRRPSKNLVKNILFLKQFFWKLLKLNP